MVFGFLWCVVGSSAPSDSMYLVSITLLQFYANLFETEDNFVMVRRYAFDLDIILRLIFITFSTF